MGRLVVNYLITRKFFSWNFYKKNYETFPILFLMAGDIIGFTTATIHGFRHYDYMFLKSTRDRHEEYDQFLKFYNHQWWIGPDLNAELNKNNPRKDLYDLYTEMERRLKGAEAKQEECPKE